MKKMTLLAGLLPAFLLLANTAMADEPTARLYVGINLGTAQSSYIEDAVEGGISAGAEVDSKDKAAGWKLYGGIDINDYVAVQADVVSLGKITYKERNASGAAYHFNASSSAAGVYGNLLLKLPLAEGRGALFAKAGLGFVAVEQKVDGSVGSSFSMMLSDTDTAASFNAGVGIRFNLNANWGLVAEAERYLINIEDEDGEADFSAYKVNLVTAGVYYRF